MTDARIFPARPLVGVGAVVWHSTDVLLVRRARPPNVGSWSIPGGGLEPGETLLEAIAREVREEVGLELRNLVMIAAVELIRLDPDGRVRYHYLLADATADATAEAADPCQLTPDPAEISEAGWFDPDRLDGFSLWEETRRVIELARRARAQA